MAKLKLSAVPDEPVGMSALRVTIWHGSQELR